MTTKVKTNKSPIATAAMQSAQSEMVQMAITCGAIFHECKGQGFTRDESLQIVLKMIECSIAASS